MTANATITRRSFVAGTAAVAGLAAAATGTALADEAAPAEGFSAQDWLGEAPAMPEQFAEELECDVVVVGLGHAGCAATRAAAEAGCSVIAFEKSFNVGLGSKDFCAFGSQLFSEAFPEVAEKYFTDEGRQLLLNEIAKGCTNRNDMRITRKWLDINGENVDWYLSAPGLENISLGTEENGNTYDRDADYYVYATNYPLPANYNPFEEHMPCLPGTFKAMGVDRGFLWANLDRAADAAGDALQIRHETLVVQLVKEEGRIAGVVAQDAEGNYIKATAKNGVVLATGDFMNNGNMLAAFLPEILASGYEPFGEHNWYSTMQDGKPTNTGDGHRMAVWAGGHMQAYGCSMSHLTGGGSSVFGTMPFLALNKKGARFMNEDIQGQGYAEQVRQLPGRTAYQIYDGAVFDQLADMPYGHGKNHLANQDALDARIEAGTTFVADTLEELFAQIDIDVETALASVARYNDLCSNGYDEDLGKAAKYLFPVQNPPYYASIVGRGDDLVTMSGIVCDENCRVLDAEGDVLPGLYVAGNVQGGRFAVIYPECALGISVSMAASFGREAGMNAAAL